ncbi:MAG TPA: sialidase [Armatimonadetes bacterium]|nr:sialidase [Armatimonadota bacterium]
MSADVEKIRLLPPSPTNPRNSEGSFIRLKDRRLLFVYSHYDGTGGADHDSAYLAGRYSSDGGRSWTDEDVTILPNEGGCNVMSVSLLRMANDDLGMLYLRKDTPGTLCRGFIRRSSDEGRTWSESVLATPRLTYIVINNDRVVRLASGRLLVPASLHYLTEDPKWHQAGRFTCYISDDDGALWQQGHSTLLAPEESRSGLQEPCVIELRDGRVMMLARTDMGCHYRSYSEDGGVTWSPAEPTDLKTSCVSPASIRRIPQTGDLLIVYNDASSITPEYEGKRTPLVAAISKDEGQTWENHRWLEDDPAGWYCYTAIHFLDDEDTVLLGYCAGQRATGGLNLTQITRVPIEWVYG